MRIFSVIFLLMILVSATASCTGGEAIAIGMGVGWSSHSRAFGPSSELPSWLRYEGPRDGFWFKPGADREQLKQDYGECGIKGRKSCMKEKGYFWLIPGTGFWYKIGTTQQQIVQDYSECKNTKREISCMEEKGYTWASLYGEWAKQ